MTEKSKNDSKRSSVFNAKSSKALTAFPQEDAVLTSPSVGLDKLGLFFAPTQQQVGFFLSGSDRDGDLESRAVDLPVMFLSYDSLRVCPVQVIHRQLWRTVNPAGGGEVCSNLQHRSLWRRQQQVLCRTKWATGEISVKKLLTKKRRMVFVSNDQFGLVLDEVIYCVLWHFGRNTTVITTIIQNKDSPIYIPSTQCNRDWEEQSRCIEG